MRFLWMVAALLLVGSATVLAQDRRPDARLSFSSTSVGLVIGFSKGEGSLEFAGKKYPFTISGVNVATVGVTRVSALGQVYRLRDIADFSGRYVMMDGGLTLVQGGGSAVLRNEKGVTLYLQNLQYGLDLSLGGGGIDIALVETPNATPTPTPTPQAATESVPAALQLQSHSQSQ